MKRERELTTRITAREVVGEFCKTGNLLSFVEKCMDHASYFGMYCYYNRSLFQDFIKEALKERGLTHVPNREEVQDCDGSQA